MWAERLSEFVTLFVVVNPIGALPVLLAVAGAQSSVGQRKIAIVATLVAFVTLVFFVFAGRFLLTNMGIAVRAFQISGGMVLFIVGLDMIRSDRSDPVRLPSDHMSVAIYPLAIPKLAGPGAMLAVILLTDDDRTNIAEQAMVVGVIAVVMVAALIFMLAAVPISRLIGSAGASVVGRIMGVLLAALAVNTVLTAFGDWIGLPKL